jgi:hypothetical protein
MKITIHSKSNDNGKHKDSIRDYSHWFFINSNTLSIFTYGSGNHPTATHRYENKVDFDRQIEAFKKDGYKFIKDQAE